MQPFIGLSLRIVMVFMSLLILYFFMQVTIPLIYPFIIGWIIAMTVEPIIRWLENRVKIPRWAGVTLTLFLLITLIFTFIVFIVTEIVIELTNLADFLPSLLNQIGQSIVDTFTQKNSDIRLIIDTIQTYLEKNPQSQKHISSSIQENIGLIANKGTDLITNILKGIATFISNLPYMLTVSIFVVLATFFTSLDWPKLQHRVRATIPYKMMHTSQLVFKDLKKALFGFIRAQLILISITAFIMLTGLLILGIPYAFTLAFIIGLADLLPYFGLGAVLIPWIIYLWIIGNIEHGIGLAIIYGVIIVTRQFIEPKLVANHVGLNPLLTLISLFIGLKLFGILGLIIGPVTTVMIIALHKANVFKDLKVFIMNMTPFKS